MPGGQAKWVPRGLPPALLKGWQWPVGPRHHPVPHPSEILMSPRGLAPLGVAASAADGAAERTRAMPRGINFNTRVSAAIDARISGRLSKAVKRRDDPSLAWRRALSFQANDGCLALSPR
jgi:hypothetical protein